MREIRIPASDRYTVFGLVLMVGGLALISAGFITWPL